MYLEPGWYFIDAESSYIQPLSNTHLQYNLLILNEIR